MYKVLDPSRPDNVRLPDIYETAENKSPGAIDILGLEMDKH